MCGGVNPASSILLPWMEFEALKTLPRLPGFSGEAQASGLHLYLGSQGEIFRFLKTSFDVLRVLIIRKQSTVLS